MTPSLHGAGRGEGKVVLDETFFDQCAVVCVDLQEGKCGEPMADDRLPALWKAMGFTAADVNAASDFAWDICLPNACKVVEACRRLQLPIIFLHWGYRFKNGMDLDPVVRAMMLHDHGEDFNAWSGHIDQESSQPAKCFHVREDEYALPKTAQDAFISSNIGFLLTNLGADNLVFIGGHTEACLGKTAVSAKRLGYRTLCIEDATNNARESTRRKGIEESQFDFVVDTRTFLALVDQHAQRGSLARAGRRGKHHRDGKRTHRSDYSSRSTTTRFPSKPSQEPDSTCTTSSVRSSAPTLTSSRCSAS